MSQQETRLNVRVPESLKKTLRIRSVALSTSMQEMTIAAVTELLKQPDSKILEIVGKNKEA